MNIDITNRNELRSLLSKLTNETVAQWGVMQPQNMVEHLAEVLRYSNGKKQAQMRNTEEEALKAKEGLIYSDREISKGIKSPLLPENAAPFEFESLAVAIEHLEKELRVFDGFYRDNPTATCIQPRLGPMTGEEWIVFHNKHFTHHFKQFGLI
jgi:hypothetical protein